MGTIKNQENAWRQFIDTDKSGFPSPKKEFLGSKNSPKARSIEFGQEEKEIPVPRLETKLKLEKKAPAAETGSALYYKAHKYIGPTKSNRPNYKAKQAWEWDIYPHGISKQNGKLRVQIKQKGVNPTYPSFPNSKQGLLDAAMYRDTETMRLWESGILVRAPKFNFEHPDFKKPAKKPRRRRRRKKAPEPDLELQREQEAQSEREREMELETDYSKTSSSQFKLSSIPANDFQFSMGTGDSNDPLMLMDDFLSSAGFSSNGFSSSEDGVWKMDEMM
eukprot:1157321-Amorphochlora_amoeboformis.AAC.1